MTAPTSGGFGPTATNAPTGPGLNQAPSSTVDPSFKATLIQQLQQQLGGSFSSLTTSQVNSIVESAWQNPIYQQDWQNNQPQAIAQTVASDVAQVVTASPKAGMLAPDLVTAFGAGGVLPATTGAAPQSTTSSQVTASQVAADTAANNGQPIPSYVLKNMMSPQKAQAYGQVQAAGGAAGALQALQATTLWASWTPQQQANVVAIADVAGQYAAKYGVDATNLFQISVGVAMQESGLSDAAIGDNGNSVGLFQLDAAGGEGSGMTIQQREDATTNAMVAMNEIAKVMQQNPGASPGAIAVLAQRPSGYLSGMSASEAASTHAGQSYAGMINLVSGGSYTPGQLTIPSPEQLQAGIYDPALDPINSYIVSDWQSYYGREPSTAELNDILAHSTDYASADNYMRSLPSSIPGMNNGQLTDNQKLLDTEMTSYFGHKSTLGMVQEFFNSGWTNKAAIDLQLEDLSQMGIDPATYNTIYAANQPIMSAVYNQAGAFDPSIASQQVAQAQAAAPSQAPTHAAPTQVAQAAEKLPVHQEILPSMRGLNYNMASGSAQQMGESILGALNTPIGKVGGEVGHAIENAGGEVKKLAGDVGGWLGSHL